MTHAGMAGDEEELEGCNMAFVKIIMRAPTATDLWCQLAPKQEFMMDVDAGIRTAAARAVSASGLSFDLIVDTQDGVRLTSEISLIRL